MKRPGPMGSNRSGRGTPPIGIQPPVNAFQAAVRFHQQGRLQEAEQFYKAQLRVTPNHFDSLHSLALVSAQRGDLKAAKRLTLKALGRNTNSAEAYNTLGYILQALGRPEEAVLAYRKAIAINSDYAVAYNNLGNSLLQCKRYEEAVEHYRQATATKADFAEAYKNLGAAMLALERYDEAISYSDTALAIQPGLAGAHFHKGVALETIGRLGEARASYERAVELTPRSGRFHQSLAENTRYRADDPHLAEMEALGREMTSLPEEERMCLHFALGKALMDIGQHERAFRRLLDGNALKRNMVVYDEHAALTSLDRIRSVFTFEYMRSKAGSGNPSQVPVFILGMPRSGTSLVEQILASHPKIFGAGERGDFEKGAMNSCTPHGGGLTNPDWIREFSDPELRHLGAAYVESITRTAPDAERVTDKLPGNFRFIGLIHLALPNARIIHVRRHPLDTCISCFSKLFSGELPYTYKLEELGRYYCAYERLMAHWRAVLPVGVLLEVDYEAVVADLEGQAKRLLAYCGLDWDENCLAFHLAQRPVRTASAVQVRQPVYQNSVGRWRYYRELLTPLLDAMELRPNQECELPSD